MPPPCFPGSPGHRLDAANASTSCTEAPGHALVRNASPSPFPTMADAPATAPSSEPRPPSSSRRAIVPTSSVIVDYIEQGEPRAWDAELLRPFYT